MFETTSNKIVSKVENTKLPVSVSFDDYGKYLLMCNLPNQEELENIEQCLVPELSVREEAGKFLESYKPVFNNELVKTEAKKYRFESSAKFFNKMANLAEFSGRRDLAKHYLGIAKEKPSDSSFYLTKYVNKLLSERDFESSKKFLLEREEDLDALAYLQLAFVELNSRNLSMTKHYLETALAIDELNYEARLFAGTLSIYEGKWEEAIRNYKIALEDNPRSSALHVNMALAYWQLKQISHAESCLKKALLLNPLNKNAVSFYSDLARFMEKAQEVIPFLEFYLQFEQKDSEIWGKLGSICYHAGLHREEDTFFRKALEAFKVQNTLEPEKLGVWNNIALVNSRLGHIQLAQRYYSNAILKYSDNDDPETFFLAVYNFSALLIDNSKDLNTLVPILFSCINSDNDRLHKSIEHYEFLKLFLFLALYRTKKIDAAVDIGRQFLDDGILSADPRLELQNRLLIHYSDTDPNEEYALKLIVELRPYLKGDKAHMISEDLRRVTINNVAFALATFNMLEEAKKVISLASSEIYSSPYLTATLGMIKIRSGDRELGENLYLVGANLVKRASERERFKIRKDYEIGLSYYLEHNNKKANIYFGRVSKKAKSDDEYIVVDAKNKLSRSKLPNLK